MLIILMICSKRFEICSLYLCSEVRGAGFAYYTCDLKFGEWDMIIILVIWGMVTEIWLLYLSSIVWWPRSTHYQKSIMFLTKTSLWSISLYSSSNLIVISFKVWTSGDLSFEPCLLWYGERINLSMVNSLDTQLDSLLTLCCRHFNWRLSTRGCHLVGIISKSRCTVEGSL